MEYNLSLLEVLTLINLCFTLISLALWSTLYLAKWHIYYLFLCWGGWCWRGGQDTHLSWYSKVSLSAFTVFRLFYSVGWTVKNSVSWIFFVPGNCERSCGLFSKIAFLKFCCKFLESLVLAWNSYKPKSHDLAILLKDD